MDAEGMAGLELVDEMVGIAASELRPRISLMGKGVKLPQCYLDGSGVASMPIFAGLSIGWRRCAQQRLRLIWRPPGKRLDTAGATPWQPIFDVVPGCHSGRTGSTKLGYKAFDSILVVQNRRIVFGSFPLRETRVAHSLSCAGIRSSLWRAIPSSSSITAKCAFILLHYVVTREHRRCPLEHERRTKTNQETTASATSERSL